MAFAAVISVERIIEELINSPRISLSPSCKEMMEFAYQQLESLREVLKRLDGSSKGDCRKKVNAVDARIKEAVWKFQDLIESHVDNQMLSQSDQILRYDVHLHELNPDVDDFIQKLKKMEEEYIYELDHMMPEEAPDNAVSATTDSDVRKVKLVGSSQILREIKECCQSYTNMMIVGMAGIGKTTVCKEIFNDSFELGFECRAWVTIGRMKYPVNELERDILVQLDPNMEKLLKAKRRLPYRTKNHLLVTTTMSFEGHYLKKLLKAKRCLIVLDDVWDKYIWDHLERYLTDGAKSHVLVTTRLRDVAKSYDPPYIMQLLNKDKSWDLLRERVFGENKCPRELEKYGKKIADKCDGLPLTIVTVANLLSQAPNTAEYWKSVAEDKKSSILMAAYDQMYEVLFPSYEYLPQHLKPCFLYMGVFPLNDEISKSNIFRLWVVEGFLVPSEEEILEGSATMYLEELIDNSVVIRCQTSNYVFYNYVKTCRLQSAFWYLCYREARKSRFFHVLTSVADGFEENMKSQRRLSFHNNILFAINVVYDALEQGCASTARSLLCFGPFYPYTVPICFNLRLLKVLDALQIRFYEFPIQVLQLAHLKYLSLTYNGELPASISKLWNLQVLIIYRYMSIIKSGGPPSYVPMEIWDMQELEHIRIMGTNLPNPSSNTSLDKLLTLVGVSARTCTREVLERIPNLRKLGVQIELLPDDDMKSLHCLNHIDELSELTSLKCAVVNPKLRSEIVTLPAPLSMFPPSLVKLHLSGLGYPWEFMSIIGSLPELKVLKLRCYAFRGPKWEVKDGEFKSLSYLLVEGTDLVQFKVKSGGLYKLCDLCLKHCYKLEDFQWNGDTSSYMKIEVTDCSPSTEKFANKMRSIGLRCEAIVHSSLKDGKLK